MQKTESKSRPVTDEEIAAQQYLFEAAYNDIKAGQSRKAVIQKLAKDLDDIGYEKTRIARAIIKKLTHDPLKITTDDYVRRVLGEEYKDYSQWTKKPVQTTKEKVQEAKGKKKDIELEVQEMFQKHKTPIEEKKSVVVARKKLEADEIEGETEVELPATSKAKSTTQLEAAIAIKDELIKGLNDKYDKGMDMMQKRIDEANAEIEELAQPFQQRQYITVTAGGETVIVAYIGVVKPRDKSLGIVKKSPIPLATTEEKKLDFAEWQKNLKPGRVSVDVNIEGTNEPKENISQQST